MEKSAFKILVAEDDEIVKDVMVKFLTEEKYNVIAAVDGINAMKLLRLEDVKLVLTDLRMPGADGMDVLRTAINIDPNISVIILTAYGTLDTALEAMNEGAYDYIVKPFVMQQLLLTVRNAYKMANLKEENEKLMKHLKDTYRDLADIKTLCNDKNDTAVLNSIERIEKMRTLDITDVDSKMISNERSLSKKERDDARKYNELVNELKNR